jgi:hypothetical protein
MTSADIYLCKAQVKECFEIIRKPHFSGFSEPFKAIEPNPTITEIKEREERRKKLAQDTNKLLQMFAEHINKKGA